MSGGGFFDFRDRMLAPRREAAAARAEGDANRPEPMTVSAITALVESALKGLPPRLYVRGELSQCNRHRASGHIYLSIKDPQSCLDGVMFAGAATRLKFEPSAGMEVVLGGQIKVYAKTGRYQIYVEEMLPVGTGALELAFRQLHAKLSAEGLFEAARKRPVSPFPRRVAVITAARSAAMHDVAKVFAAVPNVRLAVFDSLVQGTTAAADLVATLRRVEASAAKLGLDAVMIVRGGGSPEDLAAFNDERLARAVAACRLPVVSGIGHEVNVSIVDLVADYHAHTPTEAAHYVLRRWKLAGETIESSSTRLRRLLATTLNQARQQLFSLARHEAFRRPLDRLHRQMQGLDHDERRLAAAGQRKLNLARRRLADAVERLRAAAPSVQLRVRQQRLLAATQRLRSLALSDVRTRLRKLAGRAERLAGAHPRHRLPLMRLRLETAARRLGRIAATQQASRLESLARFDTLLQSLSPTNVLRRGYSITLVKKGGQIVRSVDELPPGTTIVTRLPDGSVESTVDDGRQAKLFDE